MLAHAFAARFGGEPTHRSRAPGRVNLIGEHTDYNDLPVMPMALQRSVDIALRPRHDDRIRLVNNNPRFEPIDFHIGVAIPPGPPGHWGNYVKAAAQHLARHFSVSRGFDGVLASDVPVASGLSSSAALVCAVGLALARLSEVDVDARALADEMAEAERYVGTRGGGMDQAISLTALEGYASRIDFSPLRLQQIRVPSEWRFVVADTLMSAEKSGAARQAYNERTVECRRALKAVGADLVRRGSVSSAPEGYPELRDAVGWDEALNAGAAALDERLARRFRHVVTEARRVEEAQSAIESGAATEFGALMDASHESLRADYEVSSPELDRLVAIARNGGALGARLTGAGFGGCIVALSETSSVDRVVDALEAEYYRGRAFDGRLEDRLFVARPSAGASFEPM
jgi:galactokinase